MPDEVLTNLCSVCHAEPHKYKCPGCGARTCSLPCIKKHKSRTECSGRHDPTAFVPIEKLRTPAGIDHDYNFISAIDRAKQRAQRDIVEELGILREDELHPQDEDRAFYKVWKGDQLHHVLDKNWEKRRRGLRPQDHIDKRVRRRLRALDIDARTMPKGMTRQKENHTTYNRKTGWINWMVELFVYGAPGLDSQPTRILHRALDGKPLCEVLATSIKWKHGNLDWERRNQEQQNAAQEGGRISELEAKTNHHMATKSTGKRKRADPHKQPKQDPETSAWLATSLLLQDTATGQWNKLSENGAASVPLSDEEEADRYWSWRIYLHQPCRPVPGGRKAVIRLSSRDSLAEVLTGRTIVEFPTLYAFPPWSAGLPEGFVEVPGERRTDETESSNSDSDSSSDSDSDLSSSSGSRSDESGEPTAKEMKVDVDEKEAGNHTGNRDHKNGVKSRGGRLAQENWRGGRPERGGLRGRGRGRDRGGGRGRGRGQQNPPRGRTHGRPESRDGAGSNNYCNRNNSNQVPLGKRAEPESEEEGEILSDDGGPPEPMDIAREPPGYHGSYGQTEMGSGTHRAVESQPPMLGNGTEVQQPKAPGLGLVNYASDSD